MTDLRRRLYGAIVRLHPAAFRDEFGREMELDFEDALRDRGFATLLGDAVLSLLRQYTVRVFPVREEAQPISDHPFLAGQYVMVDQGSLSVFDVALASVLSALLLLAVGVAAGTPNRRFIATNPQPAPASHAGGIESAGSGPPGATGKGGREGAPQELPNAGSYGGAPFHGSGRLLLRPGATGWSLLPNARGGPPGTLREVVLQWALISGIVWLTSLFLRRSPGIGKKVVLAVLGLLGVAASLAFASVPMPPVHAQILHATGPLPSFEVATVKPRDPKVMVMITPPGSQNIVRSAGTARLLIALAFNLGGTASQRIVGGPEWIDDQKTSYVIEGKISEDLFAQMQKMTNDERHNQAILMMQSLLVDRFKLKVHFEMREMPIYELTIAKDGPKLPAPNDTKPRAPTTGPADAPHPPEMGGGERVTKDGLQIRNMTLDGMLTAPWFGLSGRPVVNKTGLTGTYDLTLHDWHPDIPAQGPNSLAPPPEGQASIFTVLQEQLGLKLVPAKAPVEVVVIDHIELPSEN